MTQILFMSPSEQLAKRVNEIAAEHDLEVDVRVGVMKEAENIVSNAIKHNTKVVISRGGTAYLLKQKFDIPVVLTKLTSGSYINAFEKIRNTHGPVAFFSVEEIHDNVKSLCYFLNVDANYYYFNDTESAIAAVKQAKKDGNVFGVGGVLTKIYAEQLNMDYYTLENNREDIETALESAQQILKSVLDGERRNRILQLHLKRYETIFNYTHDGIIAIDKKGKVEVVNKQADEILPLKNKPYEGRHIEEILPETKLPSVLQSGNKELDELMKIGNVIINTNRVPIIIDGEVEGVVATFRDIESIRNSEQKIRSNLHRKGLASRYRFSDMIGESPSIRRAIRIAKSYAHTNSNILISGEIGTGKEMFAHAIHHESSRRKNPFVTINCTNYSSQALQADLLGYEDGFSPFGVKGSKEGAFELAHGGTLFLDKIGDAPLDVQSLLAQIINTKEVRRIGGDKVIPIDVRIIASTSHNLTEKIKQEQFLEELMYSLSVLTLYIPPLHERDRDYILFCDTWFHRNFGADYALYKRQIDTIIHYFQGYEWKGNIRQLSNIVERVSVLLKNDMTVEEILSTLPHEENELVHNQDVTLGKWSRSSIVEALTTSHLNISRAARTLNCSRSTLYKKMKELNIKINNLH